MSLPNNKVPVSPSLGDVLTMERLNTLISINCHAIATVRSFDSENQTISATINYQRTYYDRKADGTYSPTLVDYPILVDVPVIFLGAGNSCLTFPIQSGDQCLILFNDRDIDNWVGGARNGPPNTPRLHSISDGIAIVGLNKVSDFNADNVALRSGPNLIEISNDVTDLKTCLTNLTGIISDLINALTTAFAAVAVPAAPLYPGWAAAAAPIIADVSSAESDIGDLLDEG